jgi:exopolysaccharide biosynthesis protein
MGDTLYLLTVEGSGATLEELGIILRQLGANSGLNLDGGGSTQLALRWPDGKVATINKGSSRAVAVCLGIRLKKPEPELEDEIETEPEE